MSTANGNDGKMQECVKALEGEILTLQHLRHPNIVQYLGFERTDRHINIFLEWVPCGSIRQVLDKYGEWLRQGQNVLLLFAASPQIGPMMCTIPSRLV